MEPDDPKLQQIAEHARAQVLELHRAYLAQVRTAAGKGPTVGVRKALAARLTEEIMTPVAELKQRDQLDGATMATIAMLSTFMEVMSVQLEAQRRITEIDVERSQNWPKDIDIS